MGLTRSAWKPGQSPLAAKVAGDTSLMQGFEHDLSRRWHAQSDHGLDGVALGDAECTCLAVGPRLRSLVAELLSEPKEEPPGLGTVVCNPMTGGVWVRGSIVRLHRHGADVPDQDWIEPFGEGWYSWRELPRPLIVCAEGWVPPS